MNKLIILFFSLFLFNTASFSQDGSDRLHVFDNRTTPDDPNVLFYIHKNTNPNAVVYALNLNENNKIDTQNPIEVFWRRYQEDGRKKKLAWLEKTFAFDFKVKPVKGKENFFAFNLIAMKDKKLYASQNKKGEPIVFMTIAGKTSLLEKLYIMVDDTKRIQSVLSIEIFGKDPKTGELIYEKIIK
jgi:hypothetical protein